MFAPIDSLSSAMSFHRERNTVLNGNLSNLETPGYRPADLRRSVTPSAGAMLVSEAGHIQGGTASDSTVVFDDGGALAGPNGNAVNLDREMAKLDANRVRYNTNAELVTRRLAMLRYAAGDGVG